MMGEDGSETREPWNHRFVGGEQGGEGLEGDREEPARAA